MGAGMVLQVYPGARQDVEEISGYEHSVHKIEPCGHHSSQIKENIGEVRAKACLRYSSVRIGNLN